MHWGPAFLPSQPTRLFQAEQARPRMGVSRPESAVQMRALRRCAKFYTAESTPDKRLNGHKKPLAGFGAGERALLQLRLLLGLGMHPRTSSVTRVTPLGGDAGASQCAAC
jgi:hypothetical protein